MIKEVYLILTGKNDLDNLRAGKFLEVVNEKERLNWDDILVIVAGFGGIDTKMAKAHGGSDVKRMKDFLVERGVPESCFVLEEKSVDTLGNMVFSYEIVEEIVRKNSLENLVVCLITEKFHMRRSRFLFGKVFGNLKGTCDFQFEFACAKNNVGGIFGLARLFFKERFVLWFLKRDFRKFGLKSFDDYKKYMFSLWMYDGLDKGLDEKYDMSKSFYDRCCRKFFHLQN